MRVPLIAGNWKMNKTISEAVAFAQELKLLAPFPGVEVLICPPYPALAPVAEVLAGTEIALGAQNVHWEDAGAFTGEVSPPMLKAAGCRYVIIGHSERRQYFGETDEIIQRKLKAALRHDLIPILCVGESLEVRERGGTFDLIAKQLEGALSGIGEEEIKELVIAYEPVWAIGTGRNARPEDAQEVNCFIRDWLARRYSPVKAGSWRIQYGGSVTPDNAAELLAQPDIDGALVGGASLKVESFAAIIRAAAKAKGA
ncbi:triose-phosphate isomerase [Ammonifex thiophilus]|uniref:Triosephosphate isomerase n=1 Tax=Ammonifex thiophilus TaxID=444093 RepID=A0A3D8P4J5_9THEO|nr:triose-phosphate isomerase [Ammonifex thiophilus]RDV82859.1 triose-phosphate isomerase [Ammonifex thiophilus]